MHEDISTTRKNNFGSKLWGRREHNRKAEWINNIEKEVQWLIIDFVSLKNLYRAQFRLIYLTKIKTFNNGDVSH